MKQIITLLQIALTVSLAGTVSAQDGLLGKANIHGLLEEVPAIPETTLTAVSRTFGSNIMNPENGRLEALYQPVRAKVVREKDAITAYYQKKQKDAYGNEKKLEAKAKQDINQNALIAEMGGVDAISKMTPEQAQIAAQKATQKLMKQYAVPGTAPMATAAEMKNKDVTTVVMQITQKMTDIQKRLQAIQEKLDVNIQSLQTSPGNFKELQEEYRKVFAQIPEVVIGETRDKDPAQLKSLIKKNTEKCRTRNEFELKQKLAWFSEARSKMKLEIDNYNRLVELFKKEEPKMTDAYNKAYLETSLAQFESNLMSLADYLAGISEKATYFAATKEREQYERVQP